jgi:hypothetical protein
MKEKKEHRRTYSISMRPSSIETLDKIAEEMGMNRSQLIEMMVISMERAETLSFGKWIHETLGKALRLSKLPDEEDKP